MRESNFAFPAQNRACVCITSQLYDRRALDTSSPLPLLNSLTHLVYLTSTSPRIREILTCDGGLERLVRLLRDFCLSPPPPENPAFIYGLSPQGIPRAPPVPTLNPKNFDRHAAYRFSQAFQCVVNIGVRGSEPIRARVVQAGTLDVVGCVLEAWLAAKGFAVGPAASASGAPRESREQRHQRRQLQLEQRQREQAQELARLLALERTLAAEEEQPATSDPDTSAASTPLGAGTPTSTVVVPGRDRSGTVVARRVWDPQEQTAAGPAIVRSRTVRARPVNSATPSTSTSRPDTETEDDGDPDNDIEMTMSQDQDTDENIPPPRRTVGIVTDSPSPAGGGDTSDALDVDAHIIINTNAADDGVAEGIVALDQNVNDDLALGAPPGAPGAIDATPRTRTTTLTLNTRNMNMHQHHHGHGHTHGHVREEMTPRAVLATLPMHTHAPMPVAMSVGTETGTGNTRGGPSLLDTPASWASTATIPNNVAPVLAPAAGGAAATGPTLAPRTAHRHHHHHHHHHHNLEEPGPFREEDVLLSLQLLAYLSKYPHVRQAFYKPRLCFHPATALAQGHSNSTSATQIPTSTATAASGRPGESWTANAWARSGSATFSLADSKKDVGFFKTLTGRGKEKASVFPITSSSGSSIGASNSNASSSASSPPVAATMSSPRMTNVFSLVERFTFRPSPTESSLPMPPPFLPPEIQYWAGVIMRNACRKDESRGGIRQCANMLCGKWESFPREFAKCRRCRKAKYCGKDCQSRAWSEGHRFWCSVREGDDATEGAAGTSSGPAAAMHLNQVNGDVDGGNLSAGGGRPVSATTQERVERRLARERERHRLTSAAGAVIADMQPGPSTATMDE